MQPKLEIRRNVILLLIALKYIYIGYLSKVGSPTFFLFLLV